MLDWTGERFIPDEGGPVIFYEHAHRYLVVGEQQPGRRILDLGSGEGYGSAWLARAGAAVIGLDLSLVAVQHAVETYAATQARFLAGSATELPFADHSFDLVTCFEVIEHLEDHDGLLREIIRVLRSDGRLFVSTPDKAVYSDQRDYRNEFHLSEMYVPEYRELLGRYFGHVRLYGQRVIAGSVLWPSSNEYGSLSICHVPAEQAPTSDSMFAETVPAMYIIAECSAHAIEERPVSIFVDRDERLLSEFSRQVSHERFRELQDEFEDERKRALEQLAKNEDELAARARALESANSQLERAQEQLDAFDQELKRVAQTYYDAVEEQERLRKLVLAREQQIAELEKGLDYVRQQKQAGWNPPWRRR